MGQLNELATYRPREPSSQVLLQVLAEGLDDFLERVDIESGGRGLPSDLVDELRGYLSCGDLRGGFARFACRSCGYERLPRCSSEIPWVSMVYIT